MNALATTPGFAHPVDDAQAVFRALLAALSRPGLPVTVFTPPPPLPQSNFSQGLLALALTLCDRDTPLWLDEAADTPQTRHHLRFHCGSPVVAEPAQAAFAFIARPEAMPRLHVFNQGRADFPDRSATLILSADLSAPHGLPYELSGPGVRGNALGRWQAFRAAGLPDWFVEDWAANQSAYPLGVDVALVETGAGDCGEPQIRLLGLPRTARLRQAVHWPAATKEAAVCM